MKSYIFMNKFIAAESQCTHQSIGQVSGFSIRYPDCSSLSKSLLGIVGYGVPPRVINSNSTTPYDHLEGNKYHKLKILQRSCAHDIQTGHESFSNVQPVFANF